MDAILLPKDFDVSAITYGVPRTNENGGKSIYLSLHKSPIVIQTPEMFAPFGKQEWSNDKGTIKYTLDLSFKSIESRETLKTFYEKMNELDEKLIDDGVVNSFDWLKKKGASREVVQALYTRLIRQPIDKNTGEIVTKYPPTFKLTLPWKDGAFQCEVYDAKRNQVDLNTLETKGARVTAIIQCLGIWVAAGKYGCTWKVLQMKVSPPQSIKGYAFKEVKNDFVVEDDDDDDDEEDNNFRNKNEDDNSIIESSDDELNPGSSKKTGQSGKKFTKK